MNILLLALFPLDLFNAAISAPLEMMADASGFLSLDKAKYLFCALLAFPFALFFRFLPNIPALKHFVGLTIGLWFGYFVFGGELIHSLITSTVVYAMVKVLPRGLAHKAVLIFALAYLCISHLYRMYVDYLGWTLDFTGPQMLLTIKFTLFAFDSHDRHYTAPELNKLSPALKHHIEKTRLHKDLSPLEYFSYIYFFSNFLSGPVPFVSEHLAFVDMTMFHEFKDSVPAGSVWASIKIFVYALITAGGVILQGIYPVKYATTAEFAARGLGYKLLFGWFSTSLTRFTYYFAWLLSESAYILTGFGYNGKEKDGSLKWDRASSVRPLQVELAPSFKDVTENWNLSADKWLRCYVYFRLPKNLQAYGLYITFFTSAFWHGFYPGYYIAFLSSAFGTTLFRQIFRRVRPRFLRADGSVSFVYTFFVTIINTFFLNYFFTAFTVLSFEGSLNFLKSTYFFGFGLLAVLYTIVSLIPVVREPDGLKHAALHTKVN